MKKISIVILATLVLGACSSKSKLAQSQGLSERGSVTYNLAHEAYLKGELIPALASIMRILEETPNNPEANNLLGLIYFRQEKFEESEKAFKKAIELDSRMSEPHVNMGALFYSQGRYKEAVVELNKALENPLYLSPERIHNNLGLAHQRLQDTKSAIYHFERAIYLDRNFYLAFQNLGKLYLELGRTKEAQKYLADAVKKCASCSEPRYHLGSLLIKEHKNAEALKLFKEGAELDPDGYYGQLCQQFLVKE